MRILNGFLQSACITNNDYGCQLINENIVIGLKWHNCAHPMAGSLISLANLCYVLVMHGIRTFQFDRQVESPYMIWYFGNVITPGEAL